MAGVHDSIPVFYAQNEKKFFENATVGVGFLALNRIHMVGKMPPLKGKKYMEKLKNRVNTYFLRRTFSRHLLSWFYLFCPDMI